MNFKQITDGTYFYTLEKIIDSTRQPIFKIIAAGVLFFVGILVFLLYDGLTASDDTAYLQEILSSIVGAMTSIIVTTYSIKLLLVQLTSQQFSPRVIRVLLLNTERNLFFGLFITAIICTYVLKISIGEFELSGNHSLLMAAKTVLGLDLLLIAIGLPFFIYDITDSINAASIANLIYNHTFDTIKRLYGEEDDSIRTTELPYVLPILEDTALTLQLRSHDSGYLQNIDYPTLCHIKTNTAIIHILKENGFEIQALYQNKMIGNFVQIEGNLLDIIVKSSADDVVQRLAKAQHQLDHCKQTHKIVHRVFKIHKYRTIDKDVNLGIRQLTDIALKAISPAVNDPATAINCIDYLGTLIHLLNKVRFPSMTARSLSSDNIFIKEAIFDDIVEFAVLPIYHYGRTDPTIVIRLLQNLGTALKGSNNLYNVEVLLKVASGIISDQAVQKPEMTLMDYEKVQDEVQKFQKKAFAKLQTVSALDPTAHAMTRDLEQKYLAL